MVINLPGSKTIFCVYEESSLKCIESELKKAFYPFFSDDYVSHSHENIITIHILSNSLIYSLSNNKRIEVNVDSPFIAYKEIVELIRENIIICNHFCYLHGAAVLFEDGARLFVGPTHSGKSTLATYFDCQERTLCISDDLLVVDMSDMSVYPISKCAHLRYNALDYLDKKTEIIYNSLINCYDYYLSDARFGKKTTINSIYFLNADFNKRQPVSVCISSNPFERCLYNMFSPYQIKHNIFSAIKLSNSIPFNDLYYSELKDAYEFIMHSIQ